MGAYSTFDCVVEEGGLAVVTFNRPERMNTVTRAMTAELRDLFDRTDADDAA